MPTFRAPRGTRDLLPAERATFRKLETIATDLARRYGYREIETPMFEGTAVFERGVGAVTDVVEKELFLLAPRSEEKESWALRPEPTAGIVRAFVQHGMQTLPQPVKLTMTGPMFRYDRPQAGRYPSSGSSTSRRSAIPALRSTPRSSSWRCAFTPRPVSPLSRSTSTRSATLSAGRRTSRS